MMDVRVAPKTAEVLCAPGSERSSSYDPSGLRFSEPPSLANRAYGRGSIVEELRRGVAALVALQWVRVA